MCQLVTGIFHGKLYIKIQYELEEKYVHTRIYFIFTVCLSHNCNKNDH